MHEQGWDVIVSGAGPAGLAAAIFCRRAGMDVLVLEKSDRPGPFPRGETVHRHPILDDLLGEGFLDGIAVHETAARRFNSPGARKRFEIHRKTPSLVFAWDAFVQRLRKRAEAAGARLQCSQEVCEPLLEDGACVGVRTRDGTEHWATTVLACDGHQSRLGRASGVAYARIRTPIVKALLSGLRDDDPGFEYYFVAHGELAYAPAFPPAVLYVFPRDAGRCEVGMMPFASVLPHLPGHIDLPDDAELLRVWREVCRHAPGFSDRVRGATVDLEGVTAIPVGGMHTETMSIPGLALLGDALGLVEASGASGILAALESARLCAAFLEAYPEDVWDRRRQIQINRFMRASDTWRRIDRLYRIVLPALGFVFGRLRTAERINRHWWAVRAFYKMG